MGDIYKIFKEKDNFIGLIFHHYVGISDKIAHFLDSQIATTDLVTPFETFIVNMLLLKNPQF